MTDRKDTPQCRFCGWHVSQPCSSLKNVELQPLLACYDSSRRVVPGAMNRVDIIKEFEEKAECPSPEDFEAARKVLDDAPVPTEGRQMYCMDDYPVNPTHYNKWVIEPIEFISKNELDFNHGNAIKYLMRHRDKNGAEDLNKAKQYIDFILKYEYGVK